VSGSLTSTAVLPTPGLTAAAALVPLPVPDANFRTWKNELAPLFSLKAVFVPSNDRAMYELITPGPMLYANISLGAVPGHRPLALGVL
jgi:hypothetical protein